ncbi:MAG: hypothetical protein IT559_06105 [Alphaproteobacteria bacterium]|nr:hypothetical protein [Alphaproteobacteria bacterium]
MARTSSVFKQVFDGVAAMKLNTFHYLQRQNQDPLYIAIKMDDPDYKGFKAVLSGARGMQAHLLSGGNFNKKIRLGEMPPEHTGGQKELVKGMTPGMIVASHGEHEIRIFKNFGGEFDLVKDSRGRDAGYFAAQTGLEAMKAFVECGGRFTNAQETRPNDQTPCDSTLMLALRQGVEGGKLFLTHGGYMDVDQKSMRHDIRPQRNFIMGRETTQENVFVGDAGTVALEQGLDVAQFYLDNGGVFLERHANTAIKQGPEVIEFFSRNGGAAFLKSTPPAPNTPGNG